MAHDVGMLCDMCDYTIDINCGDCSNPLQCDQVNQPPGSLLEFAIADFVSVYAPLHVGWFDVQRVIFARKKASQVWRPARLIVVVGLLPVVWSLTKL